tara:strand:- start:5210 stop:6169 length:960 start_codon:yes stop_codon:yes gene_type:complete
MVDIVDKLLDITKDMDAELTECKEKMLRLEERAALDAVDLKYLKQKVARRDQAIVDLKEQVHVKASGHARYVALGKELKRTMPDEDRQSLKETVEKRAEEVMKKLNTGLHELYATHSSGDKSADREHKEKVRKVSEAFKQKLATKSPIKKKGGKAGKKKEDGQPKKKRQGFRTPKNRHMTAVTPEWNKIKKAAQEKKESYISLFDYANQRWGELSDEGKKVYKDAFEAEKAARVAEKGVGDKMGADKKSVASSGADEDNTDAGADEDDDDRSGDGSGGDGGDGGDGDGGGTDGGDGGGTDDDGGGDDDDDSDSNADDAQ